MQRNQDGARLVYNMIVSDGICLFRIGFYDKNFKETLLLQCHLPCTSSQYSSIFTGWYSRSFKRLILTSLLYAVLTVSLRNLART